MFHTLTHDGRCGADNLFHSLVFLVQFAQRIHKQHVLYINSSVFVLNVFMSVYATHWLRFDWRIVFESRSLLCCCYCCCFAFFTHRMIFVCYFTIDEHYNNFSSLKIAVKSVFHLRLHYSQYRAAHHDTHVSMVFFVFILSRISMLCLVTVHYELCRIFLTFSKRRTIFFLFWTIFTVSGWFQHIFY